MSPELRDLIAEHRRKLRRVLDDHRPIFAKLESGESGLAERESAATALHSFYTGVEFIMRAIATAYDAMTPKAGDWHAALLVSMATPGPRRPALLSAEASDALGRYLDFRHRFRNIYGVELSWTLMRPLVLGLDQAMALFETDLDQFLSSAP